MPTAAIAVKFTITYKTFTKSVTGFLQVRGHAAHYSTSCGIHHHTSLPLTVLSEKVDLFFLNKYVNLTKMLGREIQQIWLLTDLSTHA